MPAKSSDPSAYDAAWQSLAGRLVQMEDGVWSMDG